MPMKFKYYLFILLLFFSFAAYSQVILQPNEIRQPFTWTSAGDVLKYEILIKEIDKKNNSREVFIHETTEEETQNCFIYIEPALPAGKYSATIKVYNILGILEDELTTYSEFIIHKAHQPEVFDVEYVLNKRSVIYLDDLENDGIIVVNGRNLFEIDRSKESIVYTEYFLTNGHHIVEPEEILSYSENNRRVTMKFDMKKLHVGKYYLVARDASGLHSGQTAASILNVKFKKSMDVDLKAGYVFPVLLHDETMNNYLGTNFFPLSGYAGVSFIPLKFHWGYLGIGLRGSYSRINGTLPDYTIDGNLIFCHGVFVLHKPFFNRRIILELHAGVGITYFSDFDFHYDHNVNSDPLNTVSLSVDAGLLIQFYFNRGLFAEIGADYILTMNQDLTMGIIQPTAAVGWQF